MASIAQRCAGLEQSLGHDTWLFSTVAYLTGDLLSPREESFSRDAERGTSAAERARPRANALRCARSSLRVAAKQARPTGEGLPGRNPRAETNSCGFGPG